VIDTHAHLHACADPPQELVERRAPALATSPVRRLRPESWTEMTESCAAADGVPPVLGIHVHRRRPVGELDRLGTLEPLAIAETGLD
jgi:Tat protein secretion system quality control protein TatD with DNase activity